MNWIRTKICLALLKSTLLCLRGSWEVCRKIAEFESDIAVSHCVKSVQIRSFSRSRAEHGPEKTPYLDTFHVVSKFIA